MSILKPPFTNPNPRFLNPITTSTPTTPTRNYKFKFRVLDLDKVVISERNARVCNQFDVVVKPSGATTSQPETRKKKDGDGGGDKQDYYLNIGYAIRCLREEFPDLFSRDLTFDIYRDDIVFKSPLNTITGIENYKSIFRALRFHGKIFFKALWIEILSVWQPMENVILIRWTVHGIPRVPWESHGRFDGISEYKLDKNGKIYAHKVDNIALNSLGKFQVLSVQEFIQSLGCPSTPKLTYFEFSSFPTNLMPSMKSEKHYLNSALELWHSHDSQEEEISQKQ